MLAVTERGQSGMQIERLLQEIEVTDTSPGMTKRKRLFNALVGAQNRHQVGNHLIMFINRAMNPVSYARDRSRGGATNSMSSLPSPVSTCAKTAESGTPTRPRRSMPRALAGRLKHGPGSRAVHAEAVNYCRAKTTSISAKAALSRSSCSATPLQKKRSSIFPAACQWDIDDLRALSFGVQRYKADMVLAGALSVVDYKVDRRQSTRDLDRFEGDTDRE
ncbi:hypothetical protein [Pseudomonas sp. Q2-TVG4-2]|uniref:hypothetical protein n=1 Tax=Pseudomonas sp. Q2-TVG4-2 TaxID=1685699 RepID=UPI002810E45E|nr:hypothetical protein [Pseudomonas sp. Q2-TVG4-2]